MTENLSSNEEFSEPIILLRFDKYYFIQPLVHSAGRVNLLMTQDCHIIDEALKQETFDVNQLMFITLCLVHDHQYLWQRDAALTLKESFNIAPSNSKKFVFTPIMVDDLNHPKKPRHEERLEHLTSWYDRLENSNHHVFNALIRSNKKSAISYHKRLERHQGR